MSTTRIMKIEEVLANGFEKVNTKQDMVHKELTDHRIEMATRLSDVGHKADAAHVRMDNHKRDHEKAKGWWLALWISVIGTALGTLLTWLTTRGNPR